MCIRDRFDTPEIAPLVEADGAYYLELFHGATIAFKDMALSILPHLLITAARKNEVKEDIVILTATSGDTGKAALAGFADVEGTKIIVFYPKNGVSPIQEKQMVTQKGDNTFVVGIHGNFDQAQTLSLIHILICATMVERGKPAPDVYAYACHTLGVTPEECYAVEDSPNGVRSAHDAGCRVIMIPDLTQPDKATGKLLHRKLDTFGALRNMPVE